MIGKDREIFALTGSLGSGVTTAAKRLVKELDSKVFRVTGEKWNADDPKEEMGDGAYRLSRLIEEEAERQGKKRNRKGEFDRKLLQQLGNELRRKDTGYLVKQLLERIDLVERKIGDNCTWPIIIDGIKNSGEVVELRKFHKFFLFSIDADKETRWGRKKNDYEGNQAEFDDDDDRDHNENIEYGQQVDKCVYASDILINNESEKKILYDKIKSFLSLIKQETYRRPMTFETIMTQAYCVSLNSSCLKRKVGAVLVGIDGIPIVSSHNEVPHPAEPCEKQFGMCYRDKVKTDLIKQIKNCPNCGSTVEQAVSCPACGSTTAINDLTPKCNSCKTDLDLDSFFICRNCKFKIIDKFIGKRMEICRALHAEEKTILQLSKLGMGIPLENSSVTLYTTTFPCPQCANKIVGTGIKKIIYVEPYPTKESKDLLEKALGEANIVKFEGVKARAYFRIFDRTVEKSQ